MTFRPVIAMPRSCRLVLTSRREAGTSAATLVFALQGSVDVRTPLRSIDVAAALYTLSANELTVTNPFPHGAMQSCACCSISQRPSMRSSACLTAVRLPSCQKQRVKQQDSFPLLSSTDCDFSVSLLQGVALAATSTMGAAARSKHAASRSVVLDKKGRQPEAAAGCSTGQALKTGDGRFPDAFGVDRHRLRLRAGASDRLRLSFLPLAPAVANAASASCSSGNIAAAVPSQSPLLHALLVLSDSKCGEFTYELHGCVTPPAPCLEHKATVGLDGAQTLELSLPWSNAQLDAGRRLYLDKHPMAKDKEQAARLHWELGAPSVESAAGDRCLVYSVICSSALLSCPPTLTLRGGVAPATVAAGLPAASASDAAGASTSAAPAPQRNPMQQQQPPVMAAAGSTGCNMLRLSLRPKGPGVYPARIILHSADDVRILSLEILARSSGQACTLDLECPARQQVGLARTPYMGTSNLSML